MPRSRFVTFCFLLLGQGIFCFKSKYEIGFSLGSNGIEIPVGMFIVVRLSKKYCYNVKKSISRSLRVLGKMYMMGGETKKPREIPEEFSTSTKKESTRSWHEIF